MICKSREAEPLKVKKFREEYFFLSNFYEAPVEYKGIVYSSNEAAFQAQKCISDEEKKEFAELRPSSSKKKGATVDLRPDWENVKVGIMEEIVYAKFTQNKDLLEKLIATGDAVLEEGNNWNDLFWGVSLKTGKGKNNLGIILMKVREKLKSSSQLQG
ncbi:MAG: NADAR family protein [Ruminococcaceae bacterium]|nr:NADAR family protein [Oscillospiraceae bacterium]